MPNIVVPVYNETDVLSEFCRCLAAVLQNPCLRSEIIFVNDGSADQSLLVVRALQSIHDRITIVTLSGNFGKEVAPIAGLDHVRGDAVMVIDADLPDPPEVTPSLVNR